MTIGNSRVIKDGLQRGYRMILDHLFKQVTDICERLLLEVPKHREFLGFTGNTQTSYACGVYIDGRLEGVMAQRNWNESPIRRKIGKGKWVYLRRPYEGRSRSVKGKVRVSNGFGMETSMNFLHSYKARRNCIQIVMTTGTEYSEYLEAVAGLDVLTGTYESAKSILATGFRPMYL